MKARHWSLLLALCLACDPVQLERLPDETGGAETSAGDTTGDAPADIVDTTPPDVPRQDAPSDTVISDLQSDAPQDVADADLLGDTAGDLVEDASSDTGDADVIADTAEDLDVASDLAADTTEDGEADVIPDISVEPDTAEDPDLAAEPDVLADLGDGAEPSNRWGEALWDESRWGP